MIYKVEITNGYVGCELFYLCSERDYLASVCYTDSIICDFLSFAGSYPNIEELLGDYDDIIGEYDNMTVEEAEIELDDLVTRSIEFSKVPATLEDLNNLDIIPESGIHEESDEYVLYKIHLLRDTEIDKLLKD